MQRMHLFLLPGVIIAVCAFVDCKVSIG